MRHDFDIVFIVLRRDWEVAFRETSTEDFDLHDYLKGYRGIRRDLHSAFA
jgi:hypothetical protein